MKSAVETIGSTAPPQDAMAAAPRAGAPSPLPTESPEPSVFCSRSTRFSLAIAVFGASLLSVPSPTSISCLGSTRQRCLFPARLYSLPVAWDWRFPLVRPDSVWPSQSFVRSLLSVPSPTSILCLGSPRQRCLPPARLYSPPVASGQITTMRGGQPRPPVSPRGPSPTVATPLADASHTNAPPSANKEPQAATPSPRLLKGDAGFVTTPEQLGTFAGQLFLWHRRSQLPLEQRQAHGLTGRGVHRHPAGGHS